MRLTTALPTQAKIAVTPLGSCRDHQAELAELQTSAFGSDLRV